MNKIDIELYKTFCKSFDYNSWGEEYTRNNPPRLEDVFQRAKEKGIEHLELVLRQHGNSEYGKPYYYYLEWYGKRHLESTKYNPYLSLLNQTDEVKTELLNLFK